MLMAKSYESYYRFDGNNKRPKLTTIEGCTLEIDTARGVIRVNKNGRVKVFIKRIPIALLSAATIELVAGASGSPFDDKII
jgi:hypothetical protein